jgi:hypothetical protein
LASVKIAGAKPGMEQKIMSRITALNPANATGEAKQLLDVVQSRLGLTPNMTRAKKQVKGGGSK